MKIKRGSTSVRRLVFIADSSSTTGAGLANLAHNSAGLVAYYFAGDLSNEVQITLATATLGTYTSGGFVAVDNTNMPGWYEIGIPDAALDGGNECAIQLRGATNMVPVNVYIELDAFDYQTATQPVNVTQISGDATAADNAESFFDGTGYAGTNNVIPTVTAVTNRVTANTDQWSGVTVTGMPMPTYTQPTGFLAATFPTTVASPTNITAASGVTLAATTHTGAVIPTVTSVTNGVTINGTTTTLDALQTALNTAHGSGSWATATGFSTHSAADVWAVGTRTITGGSLTTAPPTAAAIADAVWDEARTGHTTVDTFGYYLDAQISGVSGGGGGSTDWTANERTAIRTILGIPGSGTTPADPSDGVLYDIKQKTDQIGSAGAITNLLAGAVLDPGTITSFPSELVIGDSYQETDGREIQIPLVDTDGNVLTTVGSRNLADATATFEIRRINESDSTRVITGVATIVDPPGTGTGAGAPYAIVELPADETAKGLVSYRYKGKLTLTWSGPGTDVYSFDTETIKFTY